VRKEANDPGQEPIAHPLIYKLDPEWRDALDEEAKKVEKFFSVYERPSWSRFPQ